jgi:hypothetical protein
MQVADQRLMLTQRVEHNGLVAHAGASVQKHTKQRQHHAHPIAIN